MHLLNVQIHGDRFPTSRVYPFSIPCIQGIQELQFLKRVVFFVGENGSGKSTLLDAIARKCGIHLWEKPRRHLAHNNPFETRLKDYVTTQWANGGVPGSVFRAETFRDLSDFLDDVALCDPGRLEYHGGQILNTLSHGQGILSYLSARCRVTGLYLLDEPEAALSPASQIRFLKVLRQLEDESSAQFIIATHSPILLAYPGAQILSFEPGGIREIEYEETTHYRLYRQFILDPSAFIQA
jgi:predicted ATPase